MFKNIKEHTNQARSVIPTTAHFGAGVELSPGKNISMIR